MYINKPLIHGSKFKTFSKNNQHNSQQDKKKKQLQKNDDPDQQIIQLLKVVQIFQNNFLVDELKLKKIGHPLEIDEAYEECIKLLNEQEQAQLSSHAKITKKIRMQDIQVQNYTKQFFKIREALKDQIQKLTLQISSLDDNIKLHNKKNKKRLTLMQQLQQQQLEVDIAKDKLHQLKQKSYQQKNQYIQAQASEFRLQQLIEQHQIEYKKILQNEQLVLYYKKLQIIKKKILKQKQKQVSPMQQYLQGQIDKISRKRAQIDQYENSLLFLQEKTQQQNFIIQALKQKCKIMQKDEETQQGWIKYKQKYNQIYFGNQNQGWTQYKKYLDQLLKKDEKGSFFDKKDQINQYQRKHHKYQRSIITEPAIYYGQNQKDYEQSKQDILYLKSQSTPLQLNNNQKKTFNFLPRLVKMQGKPQDQNKIKQELKKFTNDQLQLSQNVSLVSVKSGQEDSSGEVIEVQFHAKKQKQNRNLKQKSENN